MVNDLSNEKKYISDILKKTTTITYDNYHSAIQMEKYNGLLVYYFIDQQDQYDKAYMIYQAFKNVSGLPMFKDVIDSAQTFESCNLGLQRITFVNKMKIFINMLKDSSNGLPVNLYKNEESYPKRFNLSYDIVQEAFKTPENYQRVKRELLDNLNKVKINLKRSEKISRMIEGNQLKELQDYFKMENIQLKEINRYDWDILIYAIDQDTSLEFIQYLIKMYEDSNISLNYYNETDNCYINKNIGISRFETPLFKAISKTNLEVAQILLDKGADINFEKDKMEPM